MPLKDGARNDILPFAGESRENAGEILSQEAWQNDAQRRVGHQPGIARQELANKQGRQSSFMAAGLGQFIANRYTPGVSDDGDLDKVEEGLKTAVESIISEAVTLPLPVKDGGTGNSKGEAPSATILAQERTIALTGAVTGAALFNGSKDISIATTLVSSNDGIPSGLICMWSGASNAVPSGWALCNGSNGTPDLRNRFVIGAGSTYAVAATGGAANHAHTATASSTAAAGSIANATAGGTVANATATGSVANAAGGGTIGATTLNTSQIPSHTHVLGKNVNVVYQSGEMSSKFGNFGADPSGTGRNTSATGGGSSHVHSFTGTNHTHAFTGTAHSHTFTGVAHGHTFSGSNHTHTLSVAEQSTLPPYFALCYIMKL